MADASATASIEVPNRALFKASEVCDLVKVQPYVLRSWEAEFPDLGVTKSAGGPRVYRRRDVEQAIRIRHLLLVDGLTLAGARRRLEEEEAPVADGTPLEHLLSQNARDRLTEVKRGLRAILDLLAGQTTPDKVLRAGREDRVARRGSGARSPSRSSKKPPPSAAHRRKRSG
jgi:DNA-binding transcriptional MerR regulator